MLQGNITYHWRRASGLGVKQSKGLRTAHCENLSELLQLGGAGTSCRFCAWIGVALTVAATMAERIRDAFMVNRVCVVIEPQSQSMNEEYGFLLKIEQERRLISNDPSQSARQNTEEFH
jgi:hypothetical protein